MKGSIRSTVSGLALVLGGSLLVASGGALAQAQTSASNRGTPFFSAAPGSLDFGAVDVGGTPAQQTIVVTNTGSASGSVTPTTNNFLFQVSGCRAPLAARTGTCTLTVTFSPRAVGIVTGSLSIARGLGVSLRGEGLGVAKIAVTPSRLELRCSPPKGGPDVGTVRVANVGSAKLLNITASGLSDVFSANTSGCTNGVNVGAPSCPVVVTYRPVSKNPATATLTIGSNGGPGRVAVSGSCRNFASP